MCLALLLPLSSALAQHSSPHFLFVPLFHPKEWKVKEAHWWQVGDRDVRPPMCFLRQPVGLMDGLALFPGLMPHAVLTIGITKEDQAGQEPESCHFASQKSQELSKSRRALYKSFPQGQLAEEGLSQSWLSNLLSEGLGDKQQAPCLSCQQGLP